MRVSLFLAGMMMTPTPEGRIPNVGDRLPAFTAMDHGGRARTLEDLRGAQGLVLVLFRSADW